MKNPHGSNPTQFKNKKNSRAICCYFDFGPSFGNDVIHISNKNNENDNSFIDCSDSFECDDSSVFVGKKGASNRIKFRIFDYEVYSCK